MTDGASEIDPRALRRAFGAFATGVTVTTALDADGEPVGFTANSFSSVSLDPPLLLVCLAKSASSHAAFTEAERFAVNILSAEQRDVSMVFATRGADKFSAVDWNGAASGAPLLDGAAAWFDCARWSVAEAGDHTILIGRVLAFGDRAAEPLGYWRGAYVTFNADPDAFQPRSGVRVSAIVERRRHILLRPHAEGGWRLPSAPAFGPGDDPLSLLGKLAAAGVRAELPFVFESYDEGGAHHVVYRGNAPDAADPRLGWRWAPLADAPLGAMPSGEAATLSRYADQRAVHASGRYVGEAGGG